MPRSSGDTPAPPGSSGDTPAPRGVPRARRGVIDRVGDGVAAALAAAWVGGLGLVARHRLVVSHDTMINYAHVWYVSKRFWGGHGLPFRMPVLGHGHAFAFPYGVVPWVTAAVARPLAGDRIVTLWLAAGIAGLLVATFAAFPELRRGWGAAAVMVNPALVAAALIGQMPFTWGAALLLGAVAAWRRGRPGWAALLAALAQVTHPAVVAPLAAGAVALRLAFERAGARERSLPGSRCVAPHPERAEALGDTRGPVAPPSGSRGRRRGVSGGPRGAEPPECRLLRWYTLSTIPMIPAAWLVVRSPVFEDSATAVKLANLVTTLAPRSLVLALPVALVVLLRRREPTPIPTPALTRPSGGWAPDVPSRRIGWRSAWAGPAAFAATAALLAGVWQPLLLPEASGSLWREPDRAMLSFLGSPSFERGATYRLLRVPDFKVGAYQMIRAGGRLDSEFFPESIVRRRWPSAGEYGAFLRHRRVDFVMMWGGYGRVFHVNEEQRLGELGACSPGAPVCARLVERTPRWALWSVTRP